MSTALRNSNPVSLHLASILGAFVLSVVLFLIFPFSHNLSINESSKVETENKKTFVKLSPPQPEVLSQNQNLKNLRITDTNSSSHPERVKIEIPAADFSKIAVEGVGSKSAFAIQEFATENIVDVANFEVKVFEISELDSIPRCKKRGVLQYPRKLFEYGIEGEVKLMVFINENGTLELDSVQSFTHEEFLNSAKSALKDMLYDAPTYNGEPVRARFLLPITFKINK